MGPRNKSNIEELNKDHPLKCKGCGEGQAERLILQAGGMSTPAGFRKGASDPTYQI